MPYQGYETNGYIGRVQLIDLGRDSLKARGAIDHAFQPRRATLHKNLIYSISGKELLAVDAADRDHPVVRADTELSWSVDRVFVSGEYVLELANGGSWWGWWSQGSATPPSIRVVKSSDPDHALNTLLLPNQLPVVGASLRDGKLYLAQSRSDGAIATPVDTSGGGQARAVRTERQPDRIGRGPWQFASTQLAGAKRRRRRSARVEPGPPGRLA